MFILFICNVSSFPGYTSPSYDIWYETEDRYIYFTAKSLWAFINLIGSILTAVGIVMISKIVRQILKTNPNIKHDSFILALHFSVIMLQCFFVIMS